MASEPTAPAAVERSSGPLTARLGGQGASLAMLGAGLAVAGFGVWRVATHMGAPIVTLVVMLAVVVALVWDLMQAAADRPAHVTSAEQRELDRLRVVALVPVYNEDSAALRGCLESLVRQSRPLTAMCVTDDGSTCGDYAELRTWFEAVCRERGIEAHWVRQANGGKRRAQVAGLRQGPTTDIYLTVDSDTVLDPDAVAEGLRPFADASVQSVAGMVLTANADHNLLTRMQELWFTTQQLVSRGAQSRMGSVTVNCGGLAFYRAAILTDNLDIYLSETCFGKPMHASDDSLLTLFALRRGKAVQQSSAVAFTLMPTTISHHRRQQLRWLRGSTVRSAWRFALLPVGRFAYWQHLVKWVQYGATGGLAIALLASGVLAQPAVLVWSATAAVGVQLLLAAPYLSVRRSDQSAAQRWAVYATAPLVALWQLTVMRVLRWYAIVTFRRVAQGWGTRAVVEVPAGKAMA